MENASKALIIAGAILLSILIIAIGIYIFNQANTTITSSMSSMSTQEKDAFNNEFTTYQGQQKGSNVKALLSKVASNLGTFKEEKDKIPVVMLMTKGDAATQLENSGANFFQTLNYADTDNASKYTTQISKLRNKIKDKHTYSVNMRIGSNGLILAIAIGDVTNLNSTDLENADSLMMDTMDGVNEKSDITASLPGVGTGM